MKLAKYAIKKLKILAINKLRLVLSIAATKILRLSKENVEVLFKLGYLTRSGNIFLNKLPIFQNNLYKKTLEWSLLQLVVTEKRLVQ